MEEEKYAIQVEWYDESASLNRTFTLFYYTRDQTVEMYDVKQKRTFLKRSLCPTVSETDLYIGNIISVFGRDLKLVEYLNQNTLSALQMKTERTYAMLKPEVINQMGKILSFIEEKGFRLNNMMLTRLGPQRVSEFYKEHEGRPFYDTLVSYISSGPILAMELLAPSAIANWRKTLGPTDSSVARNQAPDSLRAHFGIDKSFNAAHGSDSVEAAHRELNLIFNNQNNLVEPTDSLTLCLIKPHSILEGKIGKIVAHIQENGFTIAGLRMHRLSIADAELFFEAYKGVWEDYSAHIKHFTSGPLIAIAVATDVNSFRDFAGPFDPEIARKLQPSSLRAIFGRDLAQNAVYCTDLPNDGLREVSFHFVSIFNFTYRFT